MAHQQILVIGAAGFIGVSLVKHFLESIDDAQPATICLPCRGIDDEKNYDDL